MWTYGAHQAKLELLRTTSSKCMHVHQKTIYFQSNKLLKNSKMLKSIEAANKNNKDEIFTTKY